jgi:hypothetical protein
MNARLSRPVLDLFQHQHHLQRDRDLRRVAVGRGIPPFPLYQDEALLLARAAITSLAGDCDAH